MAWNDQIFRYCERGADPAFWAEPLNAATNAAFIIAAALSAHELARAPKPSKWLAEWMLVGLMFAIGSGSFLFHSFATRWASYADTGPIGIFMLAYLAYALRRFVGFGWASTAAGIGLFIVSLHVLGGIQCRSGLLPVTEAAKAPCLNGTAGYAPAALAMLGIGLLLAKKRHPASKYMLLASTVFLASMTFRTIDLEVCVLTKLGGDALGTHFVWHLLNATTLYILALAAIRNGQGGGNNGSTTRNARRLTL